MSSPVQLCQAFGDFATMRVVGRNGQGNRDPLTKL